MVGQTKEKDITSSMLKVFKMCEEHKIQSVAFPALGTGRPTYCVKVRVRVRENYPIQLLLYDIPSVSYTMC